MEQNSQLKLAREFIFHTNKSVFLTGKAGTGKTTFLTNLKQTLPKRMIVVAPTGVAAINAGGVTVHSFFQLSFGPNVPGAVPPNSAIMRFGREKIKLIKSLDLLVIDEVSMLRADLLDAIDAVLRRFKDRNKPFGGTQLLLIGDLQQLSPVIKEDEWSLLRPHYETVYFFSSHALKELGLVKIELTHIYRQTDTAFIQLLNKVRNNELDPDSLETLNKRHIPSFVPGKDDGYITLTTHNSTAHRINSNRLNELPGKPFVFRSEVSGDFPSYTYPTEETLELKAGAQVMFVKNDASREKRYYNGKIGVITDISSDRIEVKCPGEYDRIDVEVVEWTNVKYILNEETREVEEKTVGTFRQIPLRLAWAITIHKSQGLTFEKAIIDANLSFAHGQVYVALSRCKTLEGMVLSTPIGTHSIKTDVQVTSFSKETAENSPSFEELTEAKQSFRKNTIFELFDWTDQQRILRYQQKLVRENLTDKVWEERLKNLSEAFDRDLHTIAGKFRNQLNDLLTTTMDESDETVQTRIRKGAAYFLDKIENEILPQIRQFNPETDNTAFKKAFNRAKEDLERGFFIKQACLRKSVNGFSLEEYLRVKANADVDFQPSGTKSSKSSSRTSSDGSLYSELKAWRNSVAAENDIPEYMVLQVKTMNEIARKLPQTSEQLATISGIGKNKARKYGLEILEIVRNFCREKGIEPTQFEMELPTPERPAKPDTRQITFDLFSSGKSIEEIARERDLTPGTIESHLIRFIGEQKLDIFKVFEEKKIQKILSFLEENQDLGLSQIRSALGEEFSFSEIRAAMTHLKAADPN